MEEENKQKELPGTVSTAFLEAPAQDEVPEHDPNVLMVKTASGTYIPIPKRELPELIRHFEFTGADIDNLNCVYLERCSHVLEAREYAPDYFLDAMLQNLFKQYIRDHDLIDSKIETPMEEEIYRTRGESKLYKPGTKYKIFRWCFGKNRPAKSIDRSLNADADRHFNEEDNVFYATYPEKLTKKALKRMIKAEKRAAKNAAKVAAKALKKSPAPPKE